MEEFIKMNSWINTKGHRLLIRKKGENAHILESVFNAKESDQRVDSLAYDAIAYKSSTTGTVYMIQCIVILTTRLVDNILRL